MPMEIISLGLKGLNTTKIMSRTLTISQLKQSACAHRNSAVLEGRPKKRKGHKSPKTSLALDKMKWDLTLWAKEKGYKLESEYQFFEHRKWKFDFFIKELNCGIEYEGIQSEKSRHTSLMGYTGDAEKYNKASELGVIVLRYTVLNSNNVLRDLDNLLETKA